MAGDLPILRLQIEGATQSMVQYLSDHNQEIEEYVKASLEEFDVAAELRAIVRSELPTLLRGAFRDAVRTAIYEREVHGHLKIVAAAAVLEALQNYEGKAPHHH